ncbi:hypothetical protein C8J56DRAFT_916500 [Mycena floridula]|nr:hypothetical protein C8J56DRAFT_916500 [Mycena floridula]
MGRFNSSSNARRVRSIPAPINPVRFPRSRQNAPDLIRTFTTPSAAHRGELQDQLDGLNQISVIGTYMHGEGFVPWDRKNRGFDRILGAHETGTLEYPICGHAADPSLSEEYCRMIPRRKSKRDINDHVVGYFHATSHQCEYVAIIPRLHETGSREFPLPPNRALQVRPEDFMHDEDEDIRMAIQNSMRSSVTPPSSPGPIAGPSSQTSSVYRYPSPEPFKARVSAEHFDGRKAFDEHIIQSLRESMPQPTIPNATALGTILADFNSSAGVPLDTFHLVIMSVIACPVCRAYFSIDGFNAHRDGPGNYCLNCPWPRTVFEVPGLVEVIPPLVPQTYTAGVAPPVATDALSTALGRAWLAWDSTAGVSYEAWHMLRSGRTMCSSCGLVRAVSADSSHRDDNGICKDVGQALGQIVQADSEDM